MVGGGNTLRQTLTLEGDFDFAEGNGILIANGEFTVRTEPVETAVRVRVASISGAPWTYLDPGFELLPGDFVMVPFGVEDELLPGVVTDLGRGSYTGPIKTVADVLIPAADA